MTMFRRCAGLLPIGLRRHKPPTFVVVAVTFFIVCYVVIVRMDSASRVKVDSASRVKVVTRVPFTSPVIHIATTGTRLVRTRVKVIPQNVIEKLAKDKLKANQNNVIPPNAIAKLAKDNAQVIKENIIPPNVMDEFAKDNAKAKQKAVNYDYYDDIVNTTEEESQEFSTEVFIQSDNERELQEELEQNEQFIDDNWHNFLNKNSDDDNKKKKESHEQHLQKHDHHRQFQGIQGVVKENPNQHIKALPKYVKVFDAFAESLEKRNSIGSNKCILLKTLHGNSPICIHDPDYDEVISAELSKTGAWEPNYLYAVGAVLSMNPTMMFLDLGCNIGVYTILAAKLGHNVFALDPSKQNLRLLTKSINLGGLKSRVTLLSNAISDVHENVSLASIVGNVGATFVEPLEEADKENLDEDKLAFAITLDDLIPVFKDQEVFIKMDIETYELRALQGGENFFKEVNVRYILMEWLYHKKFDSGKEIIKLMTKYELYPHVNAHHNTKLEPENYQSWPGNIMWIKY